MLFSPDDLCTCTRDSDILLFFYLCMILFIIIVKCLTCCFCGFGVSIDGSLCLASLFSFLNSFAFLHLGLLGSAPSPEKKIQVIINIQICPRPCLIRWWCFYLLHGIVACAEMSQGKKEIIKIAKIKLCLIVSSSGVKEATLQLIQS